MATIKFVGNQWLNHAINDISVTMHENIFVSRKWSNPKQFLLGKKICCNFIFSNVLNIREPNMRKLPNGHGFRTM
jgi:hypothetical protein